MGLTREKQTSNGARFHLRRLQDPGTNQSLTHTRFLTNRSKGFARCVYLWKLRFVGTHESSFGIGRIDPCINNFFSLDGLYTCTTSRPICYAEQKGRSRQTARDEADTTAEQRVMKSTARAASSRRTHAVWWRNLERVPFL